MSNFSMKMTSAVSVVTLLATTLGTSAVSAASEFLPYAQSLVDNNVISAQSTEAGYRLGDTVTRAELAKVTANLGGYTPTDCAGNVYGDVTSTLGDLCGYVESLAEAGVVSTANANFRPGAPVTRAEMVKMLLGAVGETGSDVDAGYMDVAGLGDLAGYINRANELGCAATASYFRPNATSSRGEAFKIASCIGQFDTTTPVTPGTGSTSTGTTSTGTTSTGVVSTGGPLTVALDGTAVAQYVPMNASAVKVGSVKLTAGSKDVTVRSLTVSRSGLGNASDIVSSQGIRASQSGVIVSSSSDYYNSTSQKGNVYFYPALVVKAGTSTSVDILANLSGAQNSQHQFTLDSVTADGTVTGTPVTLGLLNTTSYVTSSITVGGSYSYTATPGKTQQTIAKVDLTAGNRDSVVNGFTLTRSGGSDLVRRFANVAVYKNGAKVGTATVSADKINVSGLATTLQSGNFQSYEIKADVLVDGSAGTNTVGFKLESSSDVSSTELSTGYSTTTTGYASYVATVTFSNVDVTYTKVSTSNQTVAPGTSNVTLFNGKLTSTVPLTVRSLVITPSAGATSGALAFANDQLSVKMNGSEVATITASDFAANSVLPITKTVSIPVDSSTPATITIVASSIKNNLGVAGAYTFTVKLSDVRDSANNNVTLISDSLVGDKTTVQAPTVTLKNATVAAPTNNTISSSSNQEVGRFALSADGDVVRLTKVVLTATGNYTSLSDLVSSSSIELWNADTNTKMSATTTVVGNAVTFDSMTNDIVKDGTQNFKVVFTSVNSLDTNYGKNFKFTVNTGALTVTTVNSSAAVALAGTATMKTYGVNVVVPTVSVISISTLKAGTPGPAIAKLKISNIDSNTGITLSGVTLFVKASAPGTNGSVADRQFTGNLCLKTEGESNVCGLTETTAGVALSAISSTTQFFALPANMTPSSMNLAKNTGSITFDVVLDNMAWNTGDNITVTAMSVDYTVGGNVVPTQSTKDQSAAVGTSTAK